MKRSARVWPPGAGGRDKARFVRLSAGFSLIELLIVIALILILTRMFWGRRGSGRQRQEQKSCQSNLQKLFIALEIYSRDNSGKFPFVAGAKSSEESLEPLVPRYTVDTGSFVCSGSSDPAPAGGEPLSRSDRRAYDEDERRAASERRYHFQRTNGF